MTMVSVIVTTKNEEAHIKNCLTSVLQQDYPQIELIVVDNQSTDATKEIARQYTALVFDRGPERSAQRNYGVSVSTGDLVLYLDADMILQPGIISEAVSVFSSRTEVVALYIPEVIVGEGFWIKVRNFERSFYDGTVIDAVRFVRSSTFKALGGFDTGLCGPEDWDFDKRVRTAGQTAVLRTPLHHNEGSFDLDFYLKKKAYYAVDFRHYIAKWGAHDPDLKKQLGPLYRFLGVYVENFRFRKMLAHPLLTFGMYYLRFCVGLTYLRARRKQIKTA